MKDTETWNPLVGTQKVFFEDQGVNYAAESCGARYLIVVKPRAGKIGNIIIPDNYAPNESTGYIVGLGDGIWDPDTKEYIPPPRGLGDMVVFGEYAGSKFDLGGKSYRTMPYDSILCVLTREEEPEDG